MNLLVPYLSTSWQKLWDIKSILSLSGFFAGEMDGSEARKTKDKKELIYCKFVISWAALLYFTLIVYQYKIHT